MAAISILFTFVLYNIGLGSLYAFLVLYLEHSLHFTPGHAYYLWGTFFALFFSASLVGGYIGGKCGQHLTVFLGLLFAAVGCLLLAHATPQSFYLGLALFVAGSGCFTPNALYCLGQCFSHKKQQRDSAFTLCFVMSNIGVLSASLGNGMISRYWGYPITFYIAAISIFCAALLFYKTHTRYHPAKIKKNVILLLTLTLIAIPAYAILRTAKISDEVLVIIGILASLGITYHITRMPTATRKPFILCIALMLFAMIFWMLSALAPSVLTLFIEHHVHKVILGIHIPTATYFSFSPIFILLLAPLFSLLWLKLDKRQKTLSTRTKLSLGIIAMGLAYVILLPGIALASKGLVASGWIIASYCLQTTGEICTAPITQSMIGTLVPSSYESLMQGWRDFTIGLSGILSGLLAQQFIPSSSTSAHLSLHHFSYHFGLYGGIACLLGFTALCLPYLTAQRRKYPG